MERLAARTDLTGNSTKRSIIGGDLNLPYADWNGNADCNSGTQAFINNLVWENGFAQVIDSPTRGDALLDVDLVRPEISFTTSNTASGKGNFGVQGISDHHGVILEVEWGGGGELLCTSGRKVIYRVPQKRCFRPENILREKYGT
jgi:hypothetical protein